MKIIISLATFIGSFIWSLSDIGLPEIVHNMIVGPISVISIYFSISAMHQIRTASESGLLKFFKLLVCYLIIILNSLLIISYIGRWVVALFIG